MRLSDGSSFVTDVSQEDLLANVRAALEKRAWLQVTSETGVVRSVNPLHVVYVEDATVTVLAPDPRGG